MKRLYVFYDGECGLCRRLREWLAAQPHLVELVFYPFQSAEARKVCPWLPTLHPERQMIVMSDDGGIYVGEKAWLMCLYALREYRGWAERLATPALRPLAQRICVMVSHNRLRLSKALFLQMEADVARTGELACAEGRCGMLKKETISHPSS